MQCDANALLMGVEGRVNVARDGQGGNSSALGQHNLTQTQPGHEANQASKAMMVVNRPQSSASFGAFI